MGHIAGIKEYWDKEIEIESILKRPIFPKWEKTILISIFVFSPIVFCLFIYYFCSFFSIPQSLFWLVLFFNFFMYREFYKLNTGEIIQNLEKRLQEKKE